MTTGTATPRVGARTSIARRLLLGLTTIVGLSSALVIALLTIFEIRAERQHLKHDIDASVNAFAQLVEPALWDVDSARMARLADAYASDPRIARLTVREASRGFTATISRSETADTALRTLQVQRDGHPLGDVSIAFDRQVYERVVFQQLYGAIGVLLIALIATLFAFQLLFRRMLRDPLDELSVLVRRYGSRSAPPNDPRPLPYAEFDELTEVLEAMRIQIRDQFKALGAANRDLEAMNWFLSMTARDIDPRELVKDVAHELKAVFKAARVSAEVAAEPGSPAQLVMEQADARLDASQSVVLELPIVLNEERAGAITLVRESARPFAPNEITLANAVASQVASSLSRFRARSAERLLRTAVEQLPEAVVIADASLRMVYANPAFTATTGYSLDEAMGKSPRDLKGFGPGDSDRESMLRAVTGGEPFFGRIKGRHKSGTIYHEDTLITPVRNEQGVTTNHISISRDVTKEMQREEAFRHSQRMDAIGQLAGGVAHDFNNMLAIVIMQLDLLESELRLGPEHTASMHNMREALNRAANLTRQLLMFSRRQAMRVGDHDLVVIVDNMLRLVRRIIGEKITVDFQPSATPVAFEGDAGMIEQVILNLCVNARDAMPEGGRLVIDTDIVDLTANSAHPGHWAHLAVSDTGTGISPEVLERIFEPFFTTKSVGHGTGLGLATTHGIVAQHGGWIDVHSDVGKGSTFDVYLPALTRAPSRGMDGAARPEPQGAATVLVVEDEDAVRSIVARSLQRLGHRVLESGSGPEALSLVSSGDAKEIDLVLTDMVMPGGMSGLELIAGLRAERPGLRAIIMSGYSLQLASDALPEDIALLQKPFSLDALDVAVSEALSR